MNRIHAIVMGLCLGVLVLLIVWMNSGGGSAGAPADGTEGGTRVLGVDRTGLTPPPGVDPNAFGEPLPARLLTDLRLVSVSPAVSRVLVDVGLEPAIVGRSRFCDFLDAEVPVVGDLMTLDVERLVALDPTHVFRQPAASTDTRPLTRLAVQRGWEMPIEVRFDGVSDVRKLLDDLSRRIGGPDDRRAAIEARCAALDARLAALVVEPSDDAIPVLALYATEPPGIFGRGTFIDQMLPAAGAVNVSEADGWIAWSIEDLVTANPPAIVLVTDQPALAESFRARVMDAWAGLGIDAVDDGRVAVVAHPDALRPCTGLINVGARLQAAIQDIRAGADG